MAIKVDVVNYIALNPESLPALALLLSTCFCNDESRRGGTEVIFKMIQKIAIHTLQSNKIVYIKQSNYNKNNIAGI